MSMIEELARFCSLHDVSAVDLERTLRKQCVKVAKERCEQDGVPPSDARIGQLTGLPRFFVGEALSKLQADSLTGPPRVFEGGDDLMLDQLGLTIHTWANDPRYTAFAGVPIDLPVSMKDVPDRATFLDLLHETAAQVPMQEALRVLESAGVIAVVDEGRSVKLISDAISYRNARARSIVRYGRVVGGMMRTLRRNRARGTTGETALFERTLVTDQPISEKAELEFHERVQESGDRWLRSIDSDQRTYVAKRGEAGRKWGLTVCMFAIPDSEVTGADDEVPEIDLLDPQNGVRFRR